MTANYEPTDISCTPPPARDDDGQLLCYALISERVSVAAIATMDAPGVYSFLPLNKVDPAELEEDAAAAEPVVPVPVPDPTAPGTPTEPGSGDQNAADTAVLASIDAALADTAELTRVLLDNNASIASVDLLAYDAPTSTLQVSVTTDTTDPSSRDDVAFFVTDIMAYLWMEDEPTRESDATIHPRLEVTVDGVIYGTPFDVMVSVADYAITQSEWLDIVTTNAALAPAPKTLAKIVGKISLPIGVARA